MSAALNATLPENDTMATYMKNTTTLPKFKESVVIGIIVTYGFPLVIFIGTIGNVLSLTVLLRKRMRKTSVNVYLAFLACADLCVLYVSAFKTWISYISNMKYQLLLVSGASCKLVIFLFVVSIHMSAWLIVAISLDRFLAVWFPLKAALLCTLRRARISSFILLIIISLCNIHIFFTTHLQVNYLSTNTSYCGPLSGHPFMTRVYPWFKLATYSLIPFTLVLLLNAGIIFRICNRINQNTSNLRERQRSTRSEVDMKLTTMLLSVSICWLVLSAPFSLWTLIIREMSEDKHQWSKEMLAKAICFLLMYLNHAINFFIYSLTGKNFRQELKELSNCCSVLRRQRRQSSVHTIGMTLRLTDREPMLTSCKYDVKRKRNSKDKAKSISMQNTTCKKSSPSTQPDKTLLTGSL